MKSTKVGITIGDPVGIGPEIVEKSLWSTAADDVVIFGHSECLPRLAGRFDIRSPGSDISGIVHGRPCMISAQAQADYLADAVVAAKQGEIAALVTAPISKTQIKKAGFAFPGHTEYLADAFSVDEFAMMFYSPKLIVTLVTIHEPLVKVSEILTKELVTSATLLTNRSLVHDLGIASPRIGVVGLNPHAGEGGLLGSEEISIIAPAVRDLIHAGLEVSGPLVPDAAFRQAASGSYDAVIAMYHDQGLIPMKLVAFEESVNVTLGLPIVRTSPDHGVAYDIAGMDKASPQSFKAALTAARTMLEHRFKSL